MIVTVQSSGCLQIGIKCFTIRENFKLRRTDFFCTLVREIDKLGRDLKLLNSINWSSNWGSNKKNTNIIDDQNLSVCTTEELLLEAPSEIVIRGMTPIFFKKI